MKFNLNKEDLVVELKKQTEKYNKMLLLFEIVIGFLSMVIILSFSLFASLFTLANWQRILVILIGFVVGMFGLCFALKIEQVAGFYICKHCNNKYVPTFSQIFWAPHIFRTRYIKCPHCNKISWQKKVIK